jgi:hypothetical protein
MMVDPELFMERSAFAVSLAVTTCMPVNLADTYNT